MAKVKSIIKNLPILGLIGLFVLLLTGKSTACRLYGVLSHDLPDDMLETHLITDPNSLSELSQIHTDGWGITYYLNFGDTPTTERGAIRVWNDPDYSMVVSQINSLEPHVTLAHIRWCTGGCCDHGSDSIANPHPFQRTKNGTTWTFAHNGGLDYTRLYLLIGDEYLNANGPYGSGVSGCITSDPYDPLVISSELYFLHILRTIEEKDWNVVNGIVEAVTELINDGESGGMIFLLSDGNTMWAFCRGSIPSYHTLYYEYNAGEGYSAVASNYPSESQGNWQLINNNELVILTGNEEPVVIDVTTFTSSTTTTTPHYPCVVETLYGEHSKETQRMRFLRDVILRHTAEGEEIIRAYYRWNPTIAKVLEENAIFREIIKSLIDEILRVMDTETAKR